MATSGSTDFIITAVQLVEEAYKLIGVKAQEQPLQAPELQDGFLALNLMVKNWQNQGLHLWTKTEGILFLIPSKTDYFLGETGDNATNLDDFVNDALTTSALITATTIEITDTSEMLAGDFIGIELDDGTRQWTTILTVDNATDLTLKTGLTAAAAIGNTVFTYTNALKRPLRILGVRRGTIGNTTEIEVRPFESRNQYFNQPNKSDQGTVVNYYYTPELINGRIYVWQTANTINDLLRFTFERPIEDFDVNSDDPDFPIEWSQPIIYNLGISLGIQYGRSSERMQAIKTLADDFLEKALGFDTDPLFLQIQPELN